MASPITCSSVIQENHHANGLAVIISNDYMNNSELKTLTGTIQDGISMKKTFDILNLAVIHEHNLTSSAMMALIQSIVSLKQFPHSYKSFVFVFSGHGNTDQCLYTNDLITTTVDIEEILKKFYPSNAPNLGNIPKLFFIDACRGDAVPQEVVVPRGGKAVRQMVPAEGNILVAYSTMSKHMSYEQGKGGVWMSRLAERLREEDASVVDILTNVNEEMMELYNGQRAYPIQQPEYISRLNKSVFFLRDARQGRTVKGPRFEAKQSPRTANKLDHIPKKDFPNASYGSLASDSVFQAGPAMHYAPVHKQGSVLPYTTLNVGYPGNHTSQVVPAINSQGGRGGLPVEETQTSHSSIVSKSTPSSIKHLEKLLTEMHGPSPNIDYSLKETRRGFKATVIAPLIGYVDGEECSTEVKAKRSAAAKAIEKLKSV